MSSNQWDEDDQCLPAPLPAHERGWRHPSEVGQQAWAFSEPPLAIGRALTAATGAIGGLLAMAVLWTMLPTQAGRSVVATVRSTIAGRAETGLATPRIAAVPTSTNPPVTTIIQQPMATYQVAIGDDATLTAVAVSVNHGSLVITTAEAITNDLTIQLLMPNGNTGDARVLFVDDRSGLAVLAPMPSDGGGSIAIESFTVATRVVAGDRLTFVGENPMTLTVSADNTIDSAWSRDASIPEGAPVVNQRGELVALCSHSNGVGRLVQLANLDDLQQAISAL